MAHLLHIDSSITGEQSTSRRLSARAARRWLAGHPGGTITYRDLAAHPIPHFDAVTGLARMVPPEKRSRAEQLSFALSVELINEIKQADTVLLGLPLYNYGPPSTIKAWVDHPIAPGVSVDAADQCRTAGATPNSSFSPPAAADTVPAHRGKAGITLSHGSGTHCQRPASNRGSSPPN